jgi:hypothetical protein
MPSRDTTKLDAAVLAYRAAPTEANRAALMAEQQRYADRFMLSQAIDYQQRTR